MSAYYATPLYKILLLFLPKYVRGTTKQKLQKNFTLRISEQEVEQLATVWKKKYSARVRLLLLLSSKKGPFPLSFLTKEGKVSSSTIQALVTEGILSMQEEPFSAEAVMEADYFLSPPKILSQEQEIAFNKIKSDLTKNSFSPHLLYGVTGSGKTEIYLQAMEVALSLGKGVLFLVPEVALATQTLERLKSRFAEKIAILHCRVSEKERKNHWQEIQDETARIIVGARSALFSPIPNLGLIIIDEEQENSYKQAGSSPYYHAREVAIMRAKFCNATIVLGSATPSLESYYNATLGKYTLSTLTQRANTATLPKVHIVDMKEEYLKQKGMVLFSSPLLDAVAKRLKKGEQSLLLLNRRGYHTSQVCLECSYTSSCPKCDTLLTFHLQENMLHCHLCGYEMRPPKLCPSCHSSSSLKFKGAGTEMVEKALYRIFPESRILRMDADTTKKQGSHELLFKKFKSGKADILVGTQMIAKGLHFPSVTLVGVLNADTTLAIPDFRASESLFQLVTQVAGRSGRSELPGEVFIQTLTPEQPTLKHAANQDFLSFFKEELESRKLFDYPPFVHLIKITLVGPDEAALLEKAIQLKGILTQKLPPTCSLLPVVPSGHAKIDGKYRFQFLIKSSKVLAASPVLLQCQQEFYHPKIQLLIDVDPTSTFF
jgi:primosomal protein N' (replication factor Y)